MKGKILNTYLSKLFIALINFGVIVLLSRYLGTMGRGLAALLIVNLHFVQIASNLLSGSTLVYFGSRKTAGELLPAAYIWALICGLASALLFYLIGDNMRQFAIDIGLLSVFQSIVTAHLNILLSKKKVIANNMLLLLQSIVLIVILWFFLANFNPHISNFVDALYFAYGLLFLITTLFVFPKVKRKDWKLQIELLKTLFNYGTKNQLAHVFQFIGFRLCYYILEKNVGLGELGIFSNAIAIAESIWLVSRSVALVQYTEIAGNENDKENRKTSLRFGSMALIVSVALAGIVGVLPQELYVWLFGNEFSEVHLLMPYLLPGIALFSIFFVLSSYFSGSGKFGVNSIVSFVSMLVIAGLAFWLIPIYGVEGAAFAYSSGLILTAILIFVVFYKKKFSGSKA